MKKGIIFAFLTALISGFSIFINKFAVSSFPDPLLFTTLKNLTVGVLIFLILSFNHFEEVKKVSLRKLTKMAVLGLIGGSIPFLLFFAGLKMGSAGMAAFIHKTLFIWVSILAAIFLKEKFSPWQLLSILMLFTGILYLGGPKALNFGQGELMVFIATLFWSFETVLVKKFLPKLDYKTAALGRMFLGGAIMSLFLILTGKFSNLSLTFQQLRWLFITSIFLLGYVLSWYKALKHAPAQIATSILTLGFVITSLLTSGFLTRKFSPNQIIGQIVILSAVSLLVYTFHFSRETHV